MAPKVSPPGKAPSRDTYPEVSISTDTPAEQKQRSVIRNAHANVPDDQFDAMLARAAETGEPLTRKAIADAGKQNAKAEAQAAVKAELHAAAATAAPSDRWQIHHASVANLANYIAPRSVDIIFTDPPYGRTALHCYQQLADFAAYALAPGGLLICLTGQAHLPDYISRLDSNAAVRYLWTAAYVCDPPYTQPASHTILAQAAWKPILLFGRADWTGTWLGNAIDVIRAGTPAANDDRLLRHDWGQQQQGMNDVLERFTRRRQDLLVVDPFCGSGTNGAAALTLGHRFIGADSDSDAVNTALGYIAGRIQDAPTPKECLSAGVLAVAQQ